VIRRVGILVIAAALGAGASLGVAACGEDREGDVQFEDGTGTAGTGTAGTGTAGTVGTEAAPTAETEPETETAETEPETDETETETETSP
jgi:hypothetical protein